MGNTHSHKNQSKTKGSLLTLHIDNQFVTNLSSLELAPFEKLPTLEDIKNAQGLSNCLINEQRFTCNKSE